MRLGRDVDFVVPYHKKVPIASNIGKPYILEATGWWGVGKAMRQIVQDIEEIPLHPGGRASVKDVLF